MRARDDGKGAVIFSGIIEMDSQGDHLHEQFSWWLDVVDSCLFGPRAVAFDFVSFFDGDGSILMPGNGPIGLRRFVEEETSHRLTFGCRQKLGGAF